jgi:NhaP-type Na+/H+ or K+/H+ antiporter
MNINSFVSNAQRLYTRLLTPKIKNRIEAISVLLPGLFFIGLGLSVLLAPALILLLVACFFVSFGILVCGLSLKFLALKRKLSMFSNQIEARLIIDPGKVGSMQSVDSLENKKVVYH